MWSIEVCIGGLGWSVIICEVSHADIIELMAVNISFSNVCSNLVGSFGLIVRFYYPHCMFLIRGMMMVRSLVLTKIVLMCFC